MSTCLSRVSGVAPARLHLHGAGQAAATATAGQAGSQTRLSLQARDEFTAGGGGSDGQPAGTPAEQAPAGAVTGPVSSPGQPHDRGPRTAVPGARWRRYAAKVVLTGVVLAGVVLAGVVVAGCSSQPAVPRGSVTSCYQFGVEAIRRHVTVTAVPAACQGLSQLEVNVAVGRALQAAAAGVRGKDRQRQLIGRDSPYLANLIHAVPAPGQPAVAAPQSGPPSRAVLSLAALAAWLVTVGLGLSMMARWITRTRRHGAQPGRRRGQC